MSPLPPDGSASSAGVLAKPASLLDQRSGSTDDVSASEGDSLRHAARAAGVGPGRLGKTDRSLWKPEDDAVILQSVAKYGHKWAQLALLLPGRSSHAIRNRYHRLGVRKRWIERREGATNVLGDAPADPVASATPSSSFGWLPSTLTVAQPQCVVPSHIQHAVPVPQLRPISSSPSWYTAPEPPTMLRRCSVADDPYWRGVLRSAYGVPPLKTNRSI